MLIAIGLAAALPAQGTPAPTPKPSPAAANAGSPPVRQAPTAPARRVVSFTSPDGTRFLLAPDDSVPQVHWAVATFADAEDEPDGIEGLGATVLRASIGGTWRTGSRDPARERQALTDLDLAWHTLLTTPQDPAAMVELRRRETAAAELGDLLAWRRTLAAVPVDRPEVVDEQPTGILTLTTIEDAIGDVANHLLERREEQALRDLPALWMRDVLQRQRQYDADPMVRVYAEVLALAMPSEAAGRFAQRPGRAMPTREQALTVWARTQRPERTVHALFGAFDPDRARATLERTFAATNLPATPPALPKPLAPIQSQRRSTVPGTGEPLAMFAWQLPAGVDPFVLQAAADWLGHPELGWLGQELRGAGRTGAQALCRAPWPVVIGGRSLLLLEVRGCELKGLADQVLQACAKATTREPTAAELAAAALRRDARWTAMTNDPRRFALELARYTLLWPGAASLLQPPERIAGRTIQQLLAAVFATNPVIVEGKP